MRTKKRSSITVPTSSLVVHLAPIFAARNIKTPFTYLLNIGIANNTAQKMLKGTSVQITYDQLTKLCTNLNCTPNDLFALREMTLPSNHALNVIKPLSAATVISITKWLEGKTIEEIESIINDKKQDVTE